MSVEFWNMSNISRKAKLCFGSLKFEKNFIDDVNIWSKDKREIFNYRELEMWDAVLTSFNNYVFEINEHYLFIIFKILFYQHNHTCDFVYFYLLHSFFIHHQCI